MIFSSWLAQRGGVDHGGVLIDGAANLIVRAREHQLCAGQPDGAVERAAPAVHDDFVLEAGGVGELPDLGGIGSGHARRGGRGHGACRARGHHAGFRARKLREPPAGRVLQLEDIDEMLRGGLLGGADFRQLERAAQIGPGAAAIDERPHADARIDIVVRGHLAHRAQSFLREILRGNVGKQRRGAGQLHEIAAIE